MCCGPLFCFFFKQKTAYEVRISDWSSDVCSSDLFGVPHIFGKTDADVAYGVAYAHAEDDFATLQEVLAMTRGRAGAMLGADGAKIDYVAALMGVRETTARDWPRLPNDVRAVFHAHAAGLKIGRATV